MRPKGALRRNEINEFITRLYDGDLHAKRVLSLANGTLGVLSSASLAVHAVGQGLAQAQGTLGKHAVKQVDRLLSNDGVVMKEFFAHWAPYMVGSRPEVLVALDWTSFARDGHETLVLSMLTSHGRATPLMWKTVQASTLKGNQTGDEEELVRRLRDVMPEGVKVTVLADRGFASCRLMTLLKEELGFEYVIRLTLLGAAGESLGYDRWLKVNTAKYRTHSLFRQGLMLYEHIPNWPEYRLRALMEAFGRMLMEQRVYRGIFGVI